MKPGHIITYLLILIFFIVPTTQTLADDPKAREIMQKVEDRDDGDNQTADMVMTFIDKHHKKCIRKIATFTKDKGKDTLRMMFFIYPADVRIRRF
ncbi:MAG: hypothetical protein PF495_00410 [Spirochaetales bacterium]|jgi:uncharacterized membrane protein|nr:hypothetical protein [Spirochaetales bacterium]